MSTDIINGLYEAFSNRDADAMGVFYSDDAQFTDPVFGDLHGNEIRAMWAMLCSQADDLEVTWSGVTATGESGSAHWEAVYTLTPSGRRVHNRIAAEFEFADGVITRHVDTFDLWQWSKMAIGPMGSLLGWAPPFKNKLRETARRGLDRYVERGDTANGTGDEAG